MTGNKTLLSSRSLGKIGEEVAILELRKKDYRIIEQNFSTVRGEIDIIAVTGRILVFIEVKTRTSDAFGSPSESIDLDKASRIRKAASCYLTKMNAAGTLGFRFDIMAIMAKKNNIMKVLKEGYHGVISDSDLTRIAAELIGSFTIDHIESAF